MEMMIGHVQSRSPQLLAPSGINASFACQYKATAVRRAGRSANKVAGRLQCKAAIEAPPKEPTSKSRVSSQSAELTPEEAADVYRDMKLGRDFEEM